VAIGIATLAPVHKVRYAAMHTGHFGNRASSAPEPTHPLALRHRLRCSFRSVGVWQQFIVPIGAFDFPLLCQEEADQALLDCRENIL
jgi:hypothetical protein